MAKHLKRTRLSRFSSWVRYAFLAIQCGITGHWDSGYTKCCRCDVDLVPMFRQSARNPTHT